MSKRTTVYADYARNDENLTGAGLIPDEKDAYDIGIKHNF